MALKLSQLDGMNGFRLDGIDDYDQSGTSVAGAGLGLISMWKFPHSLRPEGSCGMGMQEEKKSGQRTDLAQCLERR